MGHGGTLDSAASGVLGELRATNGRMQTLAELTVLRYECLFRDAKAVSLFMLLLVVGVGDGTKMLSTMLKGSKVS